MKKISLTIALTVFLMQPIFVSAEEACVELNAPVTSVADFDGNGVVNRRDIATLSKVIRKNKRIERRNHKIERYNSRRTKHHRGVERTNSRRLKETRDLIYAAMFDRNADGEIDIIDLFKATRDIKKQSTEEDQKLAAISKQVLEGTYSCVEENETVEVVEAVTAPSVVEECVLEPVFCLN